MPGSCRLVGVGGGCGGSPEALVRWDWEEEEGAGRGGGGWEEVWDI